MCECGCTMSDDRYTFPGPGKTFYVLSLSGECKSCDAPPGITIEHIKPGDALYDDYRRGDFIDGPLKFEKWPDNLGVAIVTGMRQDEFVKSTKQHLIGIASADFGEKGKIDRIGAETILEELYDDSQVKPWLVGGPKPTEAK